LSESWLASPAEDELLIEQRLLWELEGVRLRWGAAVYEEVIGEEALLP